MAAGIIDLRQLRYFIAAAEQQNFRRAAEMVNVAQPALSRQIQDLEEALGVTLFERRRKRVYLTQVGSFYLDKARELVAQAAAFRGLAQRMEDGTKGHIKLGLQEIGTRHALVLGIIRAFRQLPGIDLEIVSMTSPGQIEAIRLGKLDAGFLYDAPNEARGLERLDISVDGFGLALPEDHPLLEKEEICVNDLRGVPQIILAEDVSPSLYKRIHGAFHSAGFDPLIVDHARTEHDLFCLVSTGCGVALMTTPHVERIGVVYRPVRGIEIPRVLSMVWHGQNEQPLLAQLRALVRSEIAKQGN